METGTAYLPPNLRYKSTTVTAGKYASPVDPMGSRFEAHTSNNFKRLCWEKTLKRLGKGVKSWWVPGGINTCGVRTMMWVISTPKNKKKRHEFRTGQLPVTIYPPASDSHHQDCYWVGGRSKVPVSVPVHIQTRKVMIPHLEKTIQGSYVTTSNPQKLRVSRCHRIYTSWCMTSGSHSTCPITSGKSRYPALR